MRQFLVEIRTWLQIAFCRIAYPFAVRRLRRKVGHGEKLRVLFVVTESSKWKTQSLYNAMAKSSCFEPIVCISRPDLYFHEPREKSVEEFGRCCDFFAKKGMKIEKVFDPVSGRPTKLVALKPDIVFYQQPWFSIKGQMPYAISRWAITCYVPYMVPNYGDLRLEAEKPLHRMVFLLFMLNEWWKNIYEPCRRKMLYAGSFVATGHTALDELHFDPKCGDGRDGVIYAPHWTVGERGETGSVCHGTFRWNGRAILEYAKAHLEWKWYFRPHPNLRHALVKTGLMTPDEVDSYYAAWGEVGSVELGSYSEMFNDSAVMITDSASFLTEYAVTGKPIIWLRSAFERHVPMEPSKQLYSTYYQASDIDGLMKLFKTVLENRMDPNRALRLDALRRMDLIGKSAADNIVKIIYEVVCRRDIR